MEEWRDAVAAGSGDIRMTAAGSRSSETEGDLLFVRSESSSGRYGGRSEILRPSEAAAEKKSSSGDTRLLSQHLPLTSCTEQHMEAEDGEMEELSFVPSAVSEPRWAVHMCDHKCRGKRLQVLPVCGCCDRNRRCGRYD